MYIRMLGPPIAVTTVANGRAYAGAPGGVYDVIDGDADVLGANGWTKVCPSGTTAARPPKQHLGPYVAAPGFRFFDTTRGEIIVFDGENWRSPVSSALV